jgi:hypothetical protein
MNFFGGSFFGSGFFGAIEQAAPGVTPAGAVKRRWAQVGKKLYHATAEELREILDAYVAQEPIETPVRTKPPKKKRLATVEVAVPEVVPVELKPDYVRYKRMYDDYMAQMLLEAVLRAQDDDDVEMLLLH